MSMDFKVFRCIVIDFNGFPWISMDFDGFQWIVLGYVFRKVFDLFGFLTFQWILLDFIGFRGGVGRRIPGRPDRKW